MNRYQPRIPTASALGVCQCGCELGNRFALDHRLPIALFGKKVDVESNLYPACPQCNHYKGEELLPTFRQFVKHTFEQLAEKSLTGKMARKFGILKPVERVTFWFETFGKGFHDSR